MIDCNGYFSNQVEVIDPIKSKKYKAYIINTSMIGRIVSEIRNNTNLYNLFCYFWRDNSWNLYY